MSRDSPDMIDLDGYEDPLGIRYTGTAVRQRDGSYRAVVDVFGSVCVVQCNLKFIERAAPAETKG